MSQIEMCLSMQAAFGHVERINSQKQCSVFSWHGFVYVVLCRFICIVYVIDCFICIVYVIDCFCALALV